MKHWTFVHTRKTSAASRNIFFTSSPKLENLSTKCSLL